MKRFASFVAVLIVCIGLSACSNKAQLNTTEGCKKTAIAALPAVELPAHPDDDLGACLISQVSPDVSGAKISCEDLVSESECEAKMRGTDTSCIAFQFYKTYTCYKYKDVINNPPLSEQPVD